MPITRLLVERVEFVCFWFNARVVVLKYSEAGSVSVRTTPLFDYVAAENIAADHPQDLRRKPQEWRGLVVVYHAS